MQEFVMEKTKIIVVMFSHSCLILGVSTWITLYDWNTVFIVKHIALDSWFVQDINWKCVSELKQQVGASCFSSESWIRLPDIWMRYFFTSERVLHSLYKVGIHFLEDVVSLCVQQLIKALEWYFPPFCIWTEGETDTLFSTHKPNIAFLCMYWCTDSNGVFESNL